MSERAPRGEAIFALRKLLSKHSGTVANAHLWISERDRWLELVFAIFASAVDERELRLREVIHELALLDLLSIRTIVHSFGSDGLWLERCLEVTTEMQLNESSAAAALNAVREAAHSLHEHYDERIQKLLREQGQRVLESMTQALSLKSLPDQQALIAITYWLQNVTNLPLPLKDSKTVEFAARNNFDIDEIVDAADELDINIAFVDDLIHQEQIAFRATTITDAHQREGGSHGR